MQYMLVTLAATSTNALMDTSKNLRQFVNNNLANITRTYQVVFQKNFTCLLNILNVAICFPVPLGSIPELPAESCHEIKASEGGQAVSGTYWFYSIVPDKVALAYCDMKTEGNFTSFFSASLF